MVRVNKFSISTLAYNSCLPQTNLELNIGIAGVSHRTRLVASYFALKKKIFQ